jgi:hypothetical protein
MSEPRFYRRVLGPGLLLAVATLAVLRLTGHLQPGPPQPPAHAARPADALLVPEPGWLVRRGAEIPLTPDQARRAADVARAWDEETAAACAELDRAAQSVAHGLEATARLDQAAAQRDAEPLTRLSADLAARRHAYWDRLWADLSDAQRAKIRELRAQNPLEMR